MVLEGSPLAGTYPLSMAHSSALSSVLLFMVLLERGKGSNYPWIQLDFIPFLFESPLKDALLSLPLFTR